jgi:hypothetical protein
VDSSVVILVVLLAMFAGSLWMRSRAGKSGARWRLVSNIVTAVAAVILLCFACELFMD